MSFGNFSFVFPGTPPAQTNMDKMDCDTFFAIYWAVQAGIIQGLQAENVHAEQIGTGIWATYVDDIICW